MGNVQLSLKACARALAILTLFLLSGLAHAIAYQDHGTAVLAVASAGTQPADDVAIGGDLSECAPPALEQGLFCNHACCIVQASGPASSLDDDQAAVIAQPGAPVPRPIETRLIAFTTQAPFPASPRFLLFRNFRE